MLGKAAGGNYYHECSQLDLLWTSSWSASQVTHARKGPRRIYNHNPVGNRRGYVGRLDYDDGGHGTRWPSGRLDYVDPWRNHPANDVQIFFEARQYRLTGLNTRKVKGPDAQCIRAFS